MEDPRKEPEFREEDRAEDIVEAYLIEADATGLCALADVVAERKRQVDKEGWTAEHDDEYEDGHLALAAACYAAHPALPVRSVPFTGPHQTVDVPKFWPWSYLHWKPKSRRRDLVRAGALILAEIERLDRADLKEARKYSHECRDSRRTAARATAGDDRKDSGESGR